MPGGRLRNIWRNWNHYLVYPAFAVAVLSLIFFLPRPKTISKEIHRHISQSFPGDNVNTPREAAANSTLGVSRLGFFSRIRGRVIMLTQSQSLKNFLLSPLAIVGEHEG